MITNTSKGTVNDSLDNNKLKSLKRKSLTLDEEISMLQKGTTADQVLQGEHAVGSGKKGSKKVAKLFRPYETGCRGSVFVMCTLPKCNLIPPILVNAKEDKATLSNEDISTLSNEEIASDCLKGGPTALIHNSETGGTEQKVTKGTYSNSTGLSQWDPIDTVSKIINDIAGEVETDAPRSRFVTRMVPIQATCFASIIEIKMTAELLLKKYLHPSGCNAYQMKRKAPTFKIDFRHRYCSNVTRKEVIDTVIRIVDKLNDCKHVEGSIDSECKEIVNVSKDTSEQDKHVKCENEKNEAANTDEKPLFTVDLSNPDFTILIEVCRTLCGMSVILNASSYRNFNLFELQNHKLN